MRFPLDWIGAPTARLVLVLVLALAASHTLGLPPTVCDAVAGVVHGAMAPAAARAPARYPAETDWIEVMFVPESQVRLRGDELRDLSAANALAGVADALAPLTDHRWQRLCDVPEEQLDALRAQGIANTGQDLYDMNNVHRLRIDGGNVWQVSAALEALPGIYRARPVPLPPPLPTPAQYTQEYRSPSAWTPTGTGNNYLRIAPGGDGAGVMICDLEYAWNYTHADISRAAGSQINTDVADPFSDDRHGTAVIGILSADENGWGIDGLCPQADLRTCGTYYGTPPTFNPAGAIMVAISHMPSGSVLLLEQQWDYADPGTTREDFIPIEWYTDTWPNAQSANAVYAAIQLAAANRMYVVEAGGNGGIDTDALTWVGDSGAMIVGAGGALEDPTDGYPADDLERLSFSSFGSRFDVQGWGENVVTTGYGDLHQEGSTNNFDYTHTFSGTSSASAHVAAGVAAYAAFVQSSGGPIDADELRHRFRTRSTPQATSGLAGHIGPRPDLMQLYLLHGPWAQAFGGDYGDAPEGIVAYPSTGVIGQFPTVFAPTAGPAAFMFHLPQPSPLLYLGHGMDREYEGNGGLPFQEFYTYNFDECHDLSSFDDGLVMPTGFTIRGSWVFPCVSGPMTSLGLPCTQAIWGVDIDVEVCNQQTLGAYLNVLIDWNRDGEWGGTTTACTTPLPELVVENLLIPVTGPTPQPLSSLVPGIPPLDIGPIDGYVWARFTLTDLPLSNPSLWDGSWQATGGWFSIVRGETEDYLLHVGDAPLDVADGADGEAPSGSEPPWLGAQPNPFHAGTTIHFQLDRRSPMSVEVFDVRGRSVRTLIDGELAGGAHEIAWDGRNSRGQEVPSGVYLAAIRGAGVMETVKLFVTR
jgi:hypothetical protein